MKEKSSATKLDSQFLETGGGKTESNAIEVPEISLPNGGGAIKGIDEKFTVNAVNGTASFSIPLPFSPARGATPGVSLEYNSGSGNGTFGMGWSLNLPTIKRKTDDGLPRYLDGSGSAVNSGGTGGSTGGDTGGSTGGTGGTGVGTGGSTGTGGAGSSALHPGDSDVFLLAGAEDLVPEFKKEPDGSFSTDSKGDYLINEAVSDDGNFTIRYYRPRVEGLFARIERWRSKDTGEIKWRVTSRDNVTTLYGWTQDSRIADPVDQKKIFEWFPELVFDDKGNCTQYKYKKEDASGFDVALLHNRNRMPDGLLTYTNLYPEKILYGNKTPYLKFGDPFPGDRDYLFSTLFDYGEYDQASPFDKVKEWDFRPDAFSTYRPGFEIRTTRLCKRVMLFHHFEGAGEYVGLVRSLNFEYDIARSGIGVSNGTSAGSGGSPGSTSGGPGGSGSIPQTGFTFLKSITSSGHIKRADGSYSSKSLPPLEFEYQQHNWNSEIKSVDAADLVHAPEGINEPKYKLTDLFNEGLPGILAEDGNGWYYKHNLGDGRFENAKPVTPKPSFVVSTNRMQLTDLQGDGMKQLVDFNTEPKGYFELDDDNNWQPFRNFKELPNIDFSGPNARMIDLSGNGRADLVITEDNVFTWYPSQGRNGFSAAVKVANPLDEETGPRLLFADSEQKIFLADMSGDGLTDIVRIRNSEVSYWPNKGYGRFGKKVAMDNAPVFDHPFKFNPRYIKLADIDGSGTTDIIYLGRNRFTCWLNHSGNSFGKSPFEIDSFPPVHDQSVISLADLPGNGLACIVWSSPLPADSQKPLRYIDLMGGTKPHLMSGYCNNLGKEVSFAYTPSTKFYLDDKKAGKPWVTRLHFPVHCISETITEDKVSGYRFVSKYKYHNGYYDHPEKEFRGFGMVEQTDSETYEHWKLGDASNIVEEPLHQEPVVTKTWFNTGAFLRSGKINSHQANYYWYEEMAREGFPVLHHEAPLPATRLVAAPGLNPDVTDHLSGSEWQEVHRACKGMTVRAEVFARDAVKSGNSDEARRIELTPFTVKTGNCIIELLQPKGHNKHAVFMVKESENLTYHYERDPEDTRISHNLNIKLDQYGNVLESASVVYPRRIADPSLPSEIQADQSKTVIVYTESRYTNDVITADAYRLRMASEAKTWDLKGVERAGDYYVPSDFDDILNDTKSDTVHYYEPDKPLTPGKAQKRIIEHVRSVYYRNNLTGALPLHQLESLALSFENYQLAYTPGLVTDIFDSKVTAGLLAEGKFTHSEGDSNWWVRSGTTQYKTPAESQADAQVRFYTPISYTDPGGAVTKVRYYPNYFLFIEQTEDALGNRSSVDRFNFRTLSPGRIRDINNNISETLTDELGIIKAVAVLGKGTEADELTGLTGETSVAESAEIQNFFSAPGSVQLTTIGKNLLQRATQRFVYDPGAFVNEGKPVMVATILREEHFAANSDSAVQISFEYSNGSGEVIMKKNQAEPGIARQAVIDADNNITINEIDTSASSPPQLRWIANGRTIKNNKGNPVKQYEPWFSVTHLFEDHKELVETGVTPIMYYDAPGRLIRTKMPDGILARVEFNSWSSAAWDPNDTILETGWYHNRTNRLIDAELQAAGKDPGREKLAADKAAKHAGTPTTTHLDTAGRPVLSTEHNRHPDTMADEFYNTRAEIDTEGNLRSVTDARGNRVMQYKYDMLGNLVHINSSDAGKRWMLLNISGNPVITWDERDFEFRHSYDILHRPTQAMITGGDGAVPINNIYDRIIYGEDQLLPDRSNESLLQERNILGRPVKHYDSGGRIHTPEYDFKGLPTLTVRRLFSKYRETANWTDANLATDLEERDFTFINETDALGRLTLQVTPDNTVVIPGYNEAGLMESQRVNLHGTSAEVHYIKNIDYNEKGQRTRIVYGNNVLTRFYYDRETFRLIRLEARKQNGDPLHDWHYTYDPAGNITHIGDKNIPVTFFDNHKITGVSEYEYDAVYQLVRSSGRENDAALSFNAHDNWNDAPFMHQLNPGDPMAIRNYTREYRYDEAGNILRIQHQAAGNNWTRNYSYPAGNNRLQGTQAGGHNYNYTHHQHHGFITGMPGLEEMDWNFNEELIRTVRQKVTNGGTPETTYYQYDGSGRRIRKITENMAGEGAVPSKKEERIYISGYELYIKHSNPHSGLERVSLSLMDQGHRFAIIETRNAVDDGTEAQLVRYQHHNHLGSAALELDETARVISYEEYHPFGTTSFQAVNADIRSAAKRYRYSGMERDEETGLSYHNARYYIPWLGRWLNTDPIGTGGGINLYGYCHNNPVKLNDPGGTDPPGSDDPPLRLTPLITDITPLGVAGDLQFSNMFSADRSVSGSIALSAGARSSFILDAPGLGLRTTGIADLSGTAAVDTSLGAGALRLRGGGVLGELSGLNLVVAGEGSFRIPVPGSIGLSGLPGSLLSSIPQSEGEARLSGALSYGSFSLADFRATASLESGRFEGRLDATSVGNIADLRLDATGSIGEQGQVSIESALLRATVDVPGLSLEARGTGASTPEGNLAISATADLRLMGLPSLHATGSGTITGEGADFSGSFYGPGPLFTSYITGSFDLSTQRGISASAGVFGLTYSPSVSVSDPSPPSPGMRAIGGAPRNPWEPGGLTVGASWFGYQQGQLSFVSGGFMPDLSENIFTNPRFGITTGIHF